MTHGQLSDIERGIQTVSLRRARQIAEVLQVPFDDVVLEILREKLREAGFRSATVSVTIEPRVNGVHLDVAAAESEDKPQV